MAIIKTDGIIIRCQDYLESSKIVTCYTRDQGKISLLAKGARRPKSRLGGALDVLLHVAIIYYQKETREMQTLGQAEILHSFRSFEKDLCRFSLATTATELVGQLEMKDDPNPALFRELLDTLQALEIATNPELILYRFTWRWLERAGFKPRLRRCLNCGSIPSAGPLKFRISRGGYFCRDCDCPFDDFLQISERCIRLMLQLRDNQLRALLQLQIPASLMGELKIITWDFLQYHVGKIKEIKSLSFLNRLREFEGLNIGVN